MNWTIWLPPIAAIVLPLVLAIASGVWIVSNKISDGDRRFSDQISGLTGEIAYIKGRLDQPAMAGVAESTRTGSSEER